MTERIRQPSRRRTGSPGTGEAPRHWLRQHVLLTALWIALAIALLSEMPWLSRPVRTYLLQGDAVGLLSLLAACGPYRDRLAAAARRGPNPFLLALLGWCALSALLAPYRGFAVAELLRLFLCAGIYFTAAYGLRSQEALQAAYGVLLLGAGVALYGVVEVGAVPGADAGAVHSLFGNHENFGSFLALLLPVALAFALNREGESKVLLATQAVALIVGAALLLARTRSAWFGSGAGLLTLFLLALRYTPFRLNRANKALIIGPLAVVMIAFTLLLGMSEIAPLVSRRAATLAHVVEDTSFADRLHRWKSASRMMADRPLTGWGLGNYPVLQARWTHQGDSPDQVLAHGTSHSNLAHNFWVQWGAETGVIGLGLYAATLAAFFAAGLEALRQADAGPRRALLMGCLAAVAGGMVDAIGAPSYTFPGVSAIFWLWVGLGVAACRPTRGAGESEAAPALPPTTLGTRLGSLGFGAGVALLVLGIGLTQRP